ncbi:MAG TPA: SRPBCC domain-containing protein [Mucilaginibacter sp.]|jgi:activator of HSP90 ATPase|nr:SRPBCC domain-containing protein [Mucilaginibacter sp.]
MNSKIKDHTKRLCLKGRPVMLFVTLTLLFFSRVTLFAQTGPVTDSGIVIHQEISFKASPGRIYEILLSSKQFSECTKKSFDNFTAASAKIDPVPGGTFSVFDGHITGRILELVPGQRIVEAWRVVDWPAGIYSIARFELRPEGSGSKLIFDHTGFPEGLKAHLTEGWQQHYWDALTKYLQ